MSLILNYSNPAYFGLQLFVFMYVLAAFLSYFDFILNICAKFPFLFTRTPPPPNLMFCPLLPIVHVRWARSARNNTHARAGKYLNNFVRPRVPVVLHTSSLVSSSRFHPSCRTERSVAT
uniref:Uncharacterized protein n=1 Tax=Trypanosoma vivax (strain Y486) TaxID=1055687 RepID=G0UAR1_TRYVY|nr:hypothetical protein TVY486_1103800 [Trypanosoma vivax Y486]